MASPPDRRRREPHQLPAGRHGLTREQVATNQRERILEGVTHVVSAMGYVDMSVEDIIVAAGVSRRTFYDHYRGKEDVFLATYDRAAAALVTQVDAALAGASGFVDGMHACLSSLLDFFAADAARADMCVVEVMAAGPDAIERRNAAMATLSKMILDGASRELPKTQLPPQLIAETIVGGIYEVIYTRVLQGQLADLPGMVPDLLYSLLLPYLGAARAGEEVERVRDGVAAAERA